MVKWMKTMIQNHLRGLSQTREGKNSEEEEEEEEEGENIVGVEFVEAGTILEEDDGLGYQLPKRHRCACHLLNLMSTVDVSEATANTVYKRLSHSVFSKCWTLEQER